MTTFASTRLVLRRSRVFLAGLLLVAPASAAAQTFPADGAWTALTRFDAGSGQYLPIADVTGDALGARDIVGDAAAPLAYVHSDATHLYFRLRINQSGLSGPTNFSASSWGCVVDADSDPSDYEWSAIVDGVFAPNAVRMFLNPTQSSPGDPSDNPEALLMTYPDPLSLGQPGFGYARHVSAGSLFPRAPQTPNADFFVDWAVERSLLGSAGISDFSLLRFACGTGVNGTVLSTDFSDVAALPNLLSSPYLCDSSGCIQQTCNGFGQLCSVGEGICEAGGILVCNAQGQAVCNAVPGPPEVESCNGVDDDCDGVVDDDNPGGGGTCDTGYLGICSAGILVCAGGKLDCTVSILPGSLSDTCNGLDDDCDGGVDEGNPGGGFTCSTGFPSVCAKGMTSCDGGSLSCIPDVSPNAQIETCNEIDDDCDGDVDEGFDLGAFCSVGTGVCTATGSFVCDGLGGVICNAIPGPPDVEQCGDALDGDCDGALDNGCPDSDGDGVIDAIEKQWGTDPFDMDSDDDGLLDGLELSPNADADGDIVPNVIDPDSDNDGLFDGTEAGQNCANADTDVSAGHCVPDADDGQTTTDPLVADTDNGGVRDGGEDWNGNGKQDPEETNPAANNGADDAQNVDTDGDGLPDKLEALLGSNPNDADTDDDGLLDGREFDAHLDTDGDRLLNVLDVDSDDDAIFDGTEAGQDCSHPDTSSVISSCKVDADPSTTTSPILRDTDRGGKMDGSEDRNLNGRGDSGETDPTLGNGPDDVFGADDDQDGLSNGLEMVLGSKSKDKDSDDDGVLDGDEANPAHDLDGDGRINVRDSDSDGDGLFDGTETGLDCAHPDTTLAANACVADADAGLTTTLVLVADTDSGGVVDGVEDTNKNGVIDAGETDPNEGSDDPVDTDADGLPDKQESELGTNSLDADSDDDGLLDGQELEPAKDTDGDGLVNALDFDSDDDGLFDGLEMGRDCGDPDTDASAMRCVPDADGGKTATAPLVADTDNGGVPDGFEDVNRNGVVDVGERDPLNPADDIPNMAQCASDEQCAAGSICLIDSCVEGCRGVGGRGCPEGFVCSSRDESAGACAPGTPDSEGPDAYIGGSGCECAMDARRNGNAGVFLALVLAGGMWGRRRRR